jgi:hypothetical protein
MDCSTERGRKSAQTTHSSFSQIQRIAIKLDKKNLFQKETDFCHTAQTFNEQDYLDQNYIMYNTCWFCQSDTLFVDLMTWSK